MTSLMRAQSMSKQALTATSHDGVPDEPDVTSIRDHQRSSVFKAAFRGLL